jgi:SAM-dependent methyltransferase
LFSPGLLAGLKRIVPAPLLDRLDPFEASVRRFVLDVSRNTASGVRVLDAGAGECRFKPLFAHAGYVAVDLAEGEPAWDYSRLDAIGRLEELPFRDAAFGRVLCVVALEHTPEPARALAEFRRVLTPQGTVHLVVPQMWEQHQRPHDYFRFTSDGIRYLMNRSGLSVRRIDPVGGYFWLLGRRLMAVLSFTQKGWRWVLFPLLAPVFGLLLPLCCYYLDFLDSGRDYTLGFLCEGARQETANGEQTA